MFMPKTQNLLNIFRSIRSRYIFKQQFNKTMTKTCQKSTYTSTINSINDFQGISYAKNNAKPCLKTHKLSLGGGVKESLF